MTIVADLLGFEAFGIELDPWLVDRSMDIAERFGSRATFAEGSFVPEDFREEVELLSPEFLTATDGASGYDELGLELDHFDLVFAYPWPGEEDWLHQMVETHAHPGALLLTYDAKEGFRLTEL